MRIDTKRVDEETVSILSDALGREKKNRWEKELLKRAFLVETKRRSDTENDRELRVLR